MKKALSVLFLIVVSLCVWASDYNVLVYPSNTEISHYIEKWFPTVSNDVESAQNVPVRYNRSEVANAGEELTTAWKGTDKSTIKNHLKNNLWYEYSGTVEYYVTEDYPTIESVLRTFDFPYFNCNSGYNGNPCVKRTAKATIKIAPYKKRPKVYNIYFDNVAVGIYMEDSYFNQ